MFTELVVAVSCVLLVGCTSKDVSLISKGMAKISGRVLDSSGNGIGGVVVETIPTSSSQTTDANGGYLFTDLVPQTYAVLAKKVQYVKSSVVVKIEGGQSETITMILILGPSYFREIQPIFSANCTYAGCHETQSTYETAFRIKATAFDAENSITYRIVAGSVAGSAGGAQMPYGQPPLPVSEQLKIRDWINSSFPE